MFNFTQGIPQNPQQPLFGAPVNKNKNEERKNNIRTSLFNNNNETNTLFANLLNKAEQKEQGTLFGSNAKTNIFGAPDYNQAEKTEKEKNEQNILFGSNINKNIFGAPNNNQMEKTELEKNEQNTLFGSNINKNIFGSANDKKVENDSKESNKENKEGLFKLDIKQKNEIKNNDNLFKSPEDKKNISVNLFQKNNIDTSVIKNNLFADKKDNTVIKEKDVIKSNNENINLDKKTENKTMGLFGIPTSTNSKPEQNSPKTNIISTDIPSKKEVISTNQTSNLFSSKRIEDDDQVQSALQNLYVSDILIKAPSAYKIPSLIQENNSKKNPHNKKHKSKTIDFTFIVQIKDIPDMNDEGCNMICKSDESMNKLLRQAILYVKKKFKMTKELNEFDILLKKNGYILPINDDELIRDYIKNNDKIIIYLVHNSSNHSEDNDKVYEVLDKKNSDSSNSDTEKIIEVKEQEQEQENNINDNNNNINQKAIFNENINDSIDSSVEIKDNKNLYHTQIIKKAQNLQINKNNNKSSPINNRQNKNGTLCPTDKLPILKREGYFMIPDEYEISRMTLEEINNVENFAIFNENGKIEFEGKVSLYGINFDKLFNIEHELIEYEKGEWCHSPRGKNFNIPAKITFYNVQCNININNDNEKKMFEETLKTKCKKLLNAEFISYDFNNGTLIYRIPYFY